MKNIQLSALAGLCLSASLMAPALAQEVDEIIVSATGIPTPLAQIGASVDIITAQDLERQQITYLQDALKLKGINVPQNGGAGAVSNVFMRGLPGRYTNLIIDGISMFDPSFSNQVLWNDVTTGGVGQIEILRGSQGVLYGSNTIAGVISQFTDIGGEKVQTLRAELGEYKTTSLSLVGKGETDLTEYGYSVSKFHTDGFSAAKALEASPTAFDDDGYDNISMNTKVRTHISDAMFVDLVLRHTEGDVETDMGSNSDAQNMWSMFERDAARVAITYETGSLTHQLGLTNYDNEIENFSNSTLSWSQDTERQTAEYRGVLQINEAAQFVFGAGADQSDDGSNEIDIMSAYGLLQLRPVEMLNLTLAARRDEHDLFGRHDTYRATAALGASDFILRASYGTGFRAPTLSELYGYGGNSSLSPETSHSSELGADMKLNDSLSMSLTGFYIVIADKIAWEQTLEEIVQLDGRSHVSGAEFGAQFRLSDKWLVDFDATYTDSKKPDGAREVRVPRVQANLSFNAEVTNALTLGASLRHVNDVVDINDAVLKDYTLFNLRGSYQLSDTLQAYARLENATDKDYEVISGYSTSGRAAYIGVTSSF